MAATETAVAAAADVAAEKAAAEMTAPARTDDRPIRRRPARAVCRLGSGRSGKLVGRSPRRRRSVAQGRRGQSGENAQRECAAQEDFHGESFRVKAIR